MNPPQILPPKSGQLELTERLLSGSQAKTAYALRLNAERMVREAPGGKESIGFLTLTVGDSDPSGQKFRKVWGAEEASRRINNISRRLLRTVFDCFIVVSERHKDESIHFHILGVLKGAPDIRTGCDFAAFARRDYSTAPKRLRALWRYLRAKLPAYGFGRHELMPIKKTGEAVASYVSKYIEKNVCNRLKADRRKKLVRYHGFCPRQLKPNDFAWATRRAVAWRWKARTLAGLCNICQPHEAAEALGPRWAFKLTTLWRSTMGDDLFNGFTWDYRERERCRGILSFLCDEWAVQNFGSNSRKTWETSWQRAVARERAGELDLVNN